MAGSGTVSGFDAAGFRTAIRSAMTMGLPGDSTQAVTFVFAEVATYAHQDLNANPFDWTASATTDVAARSVQVPAAVSWGVGTIQGTAVGDFDTSKVSLTLLDVDYALVQDCDSVRINDTSYQIDAIGPPVGLFDVTVYTLYLTARG